MSDHKAPTTQTGHETQPHVMPPELMNIDAHKVEAAAAEGPLNLVIEVYAQITASMRGLAMDEADRRGLHTWRVRALGVEIPKWLHIAESEGWFPQ
jgi:hypothetical protein